MRILYLFKSYIGGESVVNWMKHFVFGIILLYDTPLVFSQTREIIIDPSKTYQTIESFTASDAWSGNFVGRYWGEKQKGQIAKWLFSQQYDASGNPAGIGLSMWRVNLGAGTLVYPPEEFSTETQYVIPPRSIITTVFDF